MLRHLLIATIRTIQHALAPVVVASVLPAQAATVSTLGTLEHNLDSVVMSADGSAYISTAERGSIMRVAHDGTREELFRAAHSYFVGVALRDQDLYITEYQRGQVLRIRNGQSRTFATGIRGAGDIIADRSSAGFIVAATHEGKVYRLDAQGVRSEIARGLRGVLGLAQDEAGTIYTASLRSGDVHRLGSNGPELLVRLSIPGDYKIGHLEYAHGYLFATGIGDHRIYRISITGNVEVFAGSTRAGHVDGPAGLARFDAPNGIAAHPQRMELLISEYSGQRLRRLAFDPEDLPPIGTAASNTRSRGELALSHLSQQPTQP